MITLAYVAALVLLAVGSVVVLAVCWLTDDEDEDSELREWSRWH